MVEVRRLAADAQGIVLCGDEDALRQAAVGGGRGRWKVGERVAERGAGGPAEGLEVGLGVHWSGWTAVSDPAHVKLKGEYSWVTGGRQPLAYHGVEAMKLRSAVKMHVKISGPSLCDGWASLANRGRAGMFASLRCRFWWLTYVRAYVTHRATGKSVRRSGVDGGFCTDKEVQSMSALISR
ncbi:hypothetical protein ABW21_db0202844 [Orbilia brochopaga]|nr:hypothetical protein ABW21_db0202844 [Drechslerella brochopaga]